MYVRASGTHGMWERAVGTQQTNRIPDNLIHHHLDKYTGQGVEVQEIVKAKQNTEEVTLCHTLSF